MNHARLTVALVGADGAGKTTIARRVEQGPPLRAKYVYMGVNPDATSHALPTTRLVRAVKRRFGVANHQGGPPDPAKRRVDPGGGMVRRLGRRIKGNLRLANQFAEEWFRQGVAWWYRTRGYVVIFDRHFYCDEFAHDVAADDANAPLLRRLHGALLRRVYPRPDLTIVLDAPADVLYARKREGSPELLERRRREYLDLADHDPHVAIVDATRSPDEVTADVIDAIRKAGS